MLRKNFIVITLIACVVVFTNFLILSQRGHAQTGQHSPSQDLTRNQPTPQGKDEPTIVQKGVMTERQRRHSKEFQDREIPGIEADETRDAGVFIDIGPGRLPVKSIINNADDYLRALTCADDTDVIVVGKIVEKASQLTENFRFVFTDYELEVQEVLKTHRDLGLGVGEQITITDPGGAVRVEGRTIAAIISREQPLRVGSHYLLFLRRLKGSDSYRLIGDRGIFGIYKDRVNPTAYDFRDESGYEDVLKKIRSTNLKCQVTQGRDR